MSDEKLRALERAAKAGDPVALERLGVELCRAGRHAWSDALVHTHTFGEETFSTTCQRCGAREDLTPEMARIRQMLRDKRDELCAAILSGVRNPLGGSFCVPETTVHYPRPVPRDARPGDAARARIFDVAP